MSKKICHNCKHRGEYFKVFDNNHHHCEHPKWKEEDFISGKTSPWDTLQEWWDKCEDFELKPKTR
jgi:hypothetical protein